ncbi:hypothetical protein [Pseudomonas aeruginosa]|uniref:hypothetical protein n=1 Tax=Pseudomonas aeruginosa TaxID=287 RepID=UPI001ADD30F4|nr:hypothetical protein [Pseudomonas aeruginosa]MBO8322466.1 hypothetical protein [Pseudomonas aeruginosa]
MLSSTMGDRGLSRKSSSGLLGSAGGSEHKVLAGNDPTPCFVIVKRQAQCCQIPATHHGFADGWAGVRGGVLTEQVLVMHTVRCNGCRVFKILKLCELDTTSTKEAVKNGLVLVRTRPAHLIEYDHPDFLNVIFVVFTADLQKVFQGVDELTFVFR